MREQYIKEVIHSEEFVREPVDNICKKIKNSSTRKIVLAGKRGAGKTTVLTNLELTGIGTEEQYIYTIFDSVGLFFLKPGKTFDEKILIHYYEILMCSKILNYIKKYYKYTFKHEFKEYEILIKNYLNEIDEYIKKIEYKKVTLNYYLNAGEISKEIIKKLKESLNIKKISLCIDRYDWTNASSEYSQNALKKYFSIFDKTIITTDDEKILHEYYKYDLKVKGYEYIMVNYSENIDYIKEIITRKIEEYNKNKTTYDKEFSPYIITDNMYKHLIKKTQGNISLIIECVNEFQKLLTWSNYRFRVEDYMTSVCESKVQQVDIYKRIVHKPNIYL